MSSYKTSSNSGPYKVGKKVRVAGGNSKGSFVGSKSSDIDKAHRKVRTAIGGLKGSSDAVRTVKSKKKGSKEVQSRINGSDAISYVDVKERLVETRSRTKRDLNKKSQNEGFESVVDGNSGQKRKRVYADSRTAEDRIFYGNDRKSRSNSRNNVVRSYLDKDRQVPRRKDREFKDSSRNTLSTGSSRSKQSDLRDKKVWRGKTACADKLTHVQKSGLGNGTSKSDRRRPLLSAKEDPNKKKYTVGSIEKPRLRRDQARKSLTTTSDLTEDRPKKKKRVIRIDPHDTSNKRLDDDIANNGEYSICSGTIQFLFDL